MTSANSRLIVGLVLMAISVPWFIWRVVIALQNGTIANTVGWAVPFVLLEISICLVVIAMIRGVLRVVWCLAVNGLVAVALGAFLWRYYLEVKGISTQAPIMSVWLSTITVGILLCVVPPLAHFVGRAKTR